jgi:hypothetical protein
MEHLSVGLKIESSRSEKSVSNVIAKIRLVSHLLFHLRYLISPEIRIGEERLDQLHDFVLFEVEHFASVPFLDNTNQTHLQ